MHEGSTMIQTREAPPPIQATPADATPEQRAFPYDRSPAMYGLSPHGLSVYRGNPLAYFFRYCAPREMRWPDFRQSEPMAVGQGVDSLMKAHLIREGWHLNRRSTFRNKGLNARSFTKFGEVKKWNRTKAVRLRIDRSWQAILASGVMDTLDPLNTVDLETDEREPTWVHGAPLNGKLDFLFRGWAPMHTGGSQVVRGQAIVDGDTISQRIVADLKVNGAFSNSGSSPIPGYTFRADVDDHDWQVYHCDPHDRAGEPMENLHFDYATQLATYCLIEDAKDQGTPEPDIYHDDRVMLFQVTFGKPTKEPKVRKDGTRRDWKFRNGRITVTLIDTVVTADFKRRVLGEYRALWGSVLSRTIVPAHLAKYGESFLWMLQARPTLEV